MRDTNTDVTILLNLGRSSVEVHPNFYEAPYLTSSIPIPKTDLRKYQIASRYLIPWPHVCQTVILRKNISIMPTIMGLRGPVGREKTFYPKMCYLYRRTRHLRVMFASIVSGRVSSTSPVEKRYVGPLARPLGLGLSHFTNRPRKYHHKVEHASGSVSVKQPMIPLSYVRPNSGVWPSRVENNARGTM